MRRHLLRYLASCCEELAVASLSVMLISLVPKRTVTVLREFRGMRQASTARTELTT